LIPLKDDNPTRTVPVVTVALIILNSAIFLYQMVLPEDLSRLITVRYGVIPYEIAHMVDLRPEIAFPVPLTLITSQFLHGGLLHLAGNMLYLWIFGNNIEDIMGHVKFLIFYLMCGAVAGTVQVVSSPDSTIPTIGASGAISGVLGAYLIRFPRARVLVVFWFLFFIRLIYVPALIVLGFWIFLQVVNAVGAPAGQGGVAWYAHIGGFAAGMVLLKLFERRQRWR